MLEVSVQTNVGKTRSVNQDAVFASAVPIGPLPNLFIVADGMGGHNGGDVASKTAVAHFCAYIRAAGDTGESFLDLLTSAANTANMAVFSQAEMNPDLAGMGTTLTACTIADGKCNIVHLGDSRAYAVVPGQIKQLTTDHSYVNEMVKAGQITQNEARDHPKRNVLTRVLGINAKMSADGYVTDAEPGSVILLCSDGLYNMVTENEITDLINSAPEDPAEALVAAANNNGGADNISVVVVKL